MLTPSIYPLESVKTLFLLPECLDDWIDESNCFRVIDALVDALDLSYLGSIG